MRAGTVSNFRKSRPVEETEGGRRNAWAELHQIVTAQIRVFETRSTQMYAAVGREPVEVSKFSEAERRAVYPR